MIIKVAVAASLLFGSGFAVATVDQTQTEDTTTIQREDSFSVLSDRAVFTQRSSRDGARKVAAEHDDKVALRKSQKALEIKKKREADRKARVRAEERRKAPVKSSSPAPARVSNTGRPTGLWLELAKCESGANLQKNTGNGYLGAYQFLPSTWQGYTHGRFGPVLSAGWPVQTFVAYRIWLKQGWGAFPGCGAKMGYPTMPEVAAP